MTAEKAEIIKLEKLDVFENIFFSTQLVSGKNFQRIFLKIKYGDEASVTNGL